ncbi:asparagine synthase (glutamine-hydrolyzing) [Alphaproteobacteria bacterium]|nr:asparagine synthase (glutamine-hydrolyzing) [Alphaproteobacteria bacterium]
MCGFAGFINRREDISNETRILFLDKLRHDLRHRGPDCGGYWIDTNSMLSICHQRLSIVDLSRAGSQPMCSIDGRLVISFNGEIYNHLELRKRLLTKKNALFRGRSDTEVFLEYISAFGLKTALEDARGAYAFSLYDRKTGFLSLVRDPFGEKPLYFYHDSQSLVFASDLRCFRHFDFVDLAIDSWSLNDFLEFGYIHAPKTIFENIFKILPGNCVTFTLSPKKIAKVSSYSFRPIVERDRHANASLDESLNRLDRAIENSVKNQSNADVEVGCYLSGGVDSSLIAAYLQSNSIKKVKTFTIKFENLAYDESKNAAEVSHFLGTEHQTIRLSEKNLIDDLTGEGLIYDEPFSDSSGHSFLAKNVSKSVKCCLSGDGADELFGGYPGYWKIKKIQAIAQKHPHLVSGGLKLLSLLPDPLVDMGGRLKKRVMNKTQPTMPLSSRVDNFFKAMEAGDESGFFIELKRLNWKKSNLLTADFAPVEKPFFGKNRLGKELPFLEQIIAFEQADYLPNDILVKSDRSSMAFGLEMRAPFLDLDVANLANSMSLDLLAKGDVPKWPLKELLFRKIPKKIVDRPKMGFNLPIAEWLRGELYSWAHDILNSNSINQSGVFDTAAVQQILAMHKSNSYDFSALIWRLIAFQNWQRKFFNAP